MDILRRCCRLGNIAEQAGLTNKCILAITECWLKPTTKFTHPTKHGASESERRNLERLAFLPLLWNVHLIAEGRKQNVSPILLADVAQRYIYVAIYGCLEEDKRNKTAKPQSDTSGQVEGTKDCTKVLVHHGHNTEHTFDQEPDKEHDDDGDVINVPNSKTLGELGNIIDTLLLILPERAPLARVVSSEWTVKTLSIADAAGCKSRGFLLNLAADILFKFSQSHLAAISPNLLHEVIGACCATENNNGREICGIVDLYLHYMAMNNKLDMETFVKMATVVPTGMRKSYDILYDVMERLLKSGRSELEAISAL